METFVVLLPLEMVLHYHREEVPPAHRLVDVGLFEKSQALTDHARWVCFGEFLGLDKLLDQFLLEQKC